MFREPHNYLPIDASDVVDAVQGRSRYGSITANYDSEFLSGGIAADVHGMADVERKTWGWMISSSLCAVFFFSVVIFLVSQDQYEAENFQFNFVNLSALSTEKLSTSSSKERAERFLDASDTQQMAHSPLLLSNAKPLTTIAKPKINCLNPGKEDLKCCADLLCGSELAEAMGNSISFKTPVINCLMTWNDTECSRMINVGNPLMDCLACNSCVAKPDSLICDSKLSTIDPSSFV